MLTFARIWGLVLGLTSAGLVAACDGESETNDDGEERQSQCGFEACGGDPVGTWNIEAFCIDLGDALAPNDEPACRNFITEYGVDAQGTITFTAEGTTSVDITSTSWFEVVVTNACSQAIGGSNVTPELCSGLHDEYASNPDFASAGCTFAPGTCSCSIETAPSISVEMGTYTLQGNQWIDEEGDVSDYCVDGDVFNTGGVAPEDSGSIRISARRVL